MNEKVESLILEHMRSMRSDISRIFETLQGMQSEMTAVRHHLRGIETMQDQHHADIGSLRSRLDRIESRLDLVEEPRGA